MSSILMIRDPNTNEWIEVTSLIGPAGKDGKDGVNGKDGTNGKDGVDGNDYVLTAADKAEIAQTVLNEFPMAEEGEY